MITEWLTYPETEVPLVHSSFPNVTTLNNEKSKRINDNEMII